MRYPAYDRHVDRNRTLSFLRSVVNSGIWTHRSPWLTRFEAEFGTWLGSDALACSSGTAALHLMLAALDLREGEVVIPELTYIATHNAVRYAGHTPIPVDVDPGTWNMSPAALYAAITPKTRAVIAVHLLGNPCEMDPLRDICDQNGLVLLEDACEALGGALRDQPLGTFGQMAAFSFYWNKHMTTGEGGMVTGKDLERIAYLRNQGADPKHPYEHAELGFNYRMTAFQAALGCSQLPTLPEVCAHHRQVRKWYQALLPPKFTYQSVLPYGRHAAWMMGVYSADPAQGVMARLRSAGVESRPMFPRISDQPVCNDRRAQKGNVNAACLAEHALLLPNSPTLQEEDVAYICEVLEGVSDGQTRKTLAVESCACAGSGG